MAELNRPFTLRIKGATSKECREAADAVELAMQRILDEGGTLSDWPDIDAEFLQDSHAGLRKSGKKAIVAVHVVVDRPLRDSRLVPIDDVAAQLTRQLETTSGIRAVHLQDALPYNPQRDYTIVFWNRMQP